MGSLGLLNMAKIKESHIVLYLLFVGTTLILCSYCSCSDDLFLKLRVNNETYREFENMLDSLCWVAYAPTNFDPEHGIRPSVESLREDLITLRQAGFNGFVTYGADITTDIGAFIRLADSIGFEGFILGIWSPNNSLEISNAKIAGQDDLVIGFCIGNEGLNRRYDLETLIRTMEEIALTTGKAVTTTEEIEDYRSIELLEIGDWLFPNVHPYWHGITDPAAAVGWTLEHYLDLLTSTDKPVFFKEVGLPSDGDSAVSEYKQANYYRLLNATEVNFAYFEAFDQPWKTHAPVEPYWGLFRSDRSPKPAADYACDK